MSELLPCPFCGADAYEYSGGGSVPVLGLRCSNTNSCGANMQRKGRSGAAWNRRAELSGYRAREAEVERLRFVLRKVEYGNTGGCAARCPDCGATKGRNHEKNCDLWAALRGDAEEGAGNGD